MRLGSHLDMQPYSSPSYADQPEDCQDPPQACCSIWQCDMRFLAVEYWADDVPKVMCTSIFKHKSACMYDTSIWTCASRKEASDVAVFWHELLCAASCHK